MKVSNRIYQLAQKLARKSDHHSYRLGCVIYRNGDIIGLGFNQLKTHPKSPHPWHSIHAEFAAALEALNRKDSLKGYYCFVYRENVSGKIGMAKPCTSCMKFLFELGIEKVFYTTNESYGVEDLKNAA